MGLIAGGTLTSLETIHRESTDKVSRNPRNCQIEKSNDVTRDAWIQYIGFTRTRTKSV
jgi:hypothetical protein